MQNKNYTFIQLLISHSQFQKKHPECTICTIKNFIYLCSTVDLSCYCHLSVFICQHYCAILFTSAAIPIICIIYLYFYPHLLFVYFIIFFVYIDVLFIYNVNVNRTVWVAFKFRSMCNDNKDNSDSDSDSC